jgi:hypothetical protein
MLLSTDNRSTIVFILLIVKMTFTLFLVWFLDLCMTLNKDIINQSNKLLVISSVQLNLVSSIAKFKIHWLDSRTLIGLVTLMIGCLLLDMCFYIELDLWCGHVRNKI